MQLRIVRAVNAWRKRYWSNHGMIDRRSGLRLSQLLLLGRELTPFRTIVQLIRLSAAGATQPETADGFVLTVDHDRLLEVPAVALGRLDASAHWSRVS
jgi:hypothetical protein